MEIVIDDMSEILLQITPLAATSVVIRYRIVPAGNASMVFAALSVPVSVDHSAGEYPVVSAQFLNSTFTISSFRAAGVHHCTVDFPPYSTFRKP